MAGTVCGKCCAFPTRWFGAERLRAAAATVVCCRDGAEQLSVDRALRALSRAEVVVMVVDGSDGVTQQVGRARHWMAWWAGGGGGGSAAVAGSN